MVDAILQLIKHTNVLLFILRPCIKPGPNTSLAGCLRVSWSVPQLDTIDKLAFCSFVQVGRRQNSIYLVLLTFSKVDALVGDDLSLAVNVVDVRVRFFVGLNGHFLNAYLPLAFPTPLLLSYSPCLLCRTREVRHFH